MQNCHRFVGHYIADMAFAAPARVAVMVPVTMTAWTNPYEREDLRVASTAGGKSMVLPFDAKFAFFFRLRH
jgi:hypothetical protein